MLKRVRQVRRVALVAAMAGGIGVSAGAAQEIDAGGWLDRCIAGFHEVEARIEAAGGRARMDMMAEVPDCFGAPLTFCRFSEAPGACAEAFGTAMDARAEALFGALPERVEGTGPGAAKLNAQLARTAPDLEGYAKPGLPWDGPLFGPVRWLGEERGRAMLARAERLKTMMLRTRQVEREREK